MSDAIRDKGNEEERWQEEKRKDDNGRRNQGLDQGKGETVG